jgi:hypothetical protein
MRPHALRGWLGAGRLARAARAASFAGSLIGVALSESRTDRATGLASISDVVGLR